MNILKKIKAIKALKLTMRLIRKIKFLTIKMNTTITKQNFNLNILQWILILKIIKNCLIRSLKI